MHTDMQLGVTLVTIIMSKSLNSGDQLKCTESLFFNTAVCLLHLVAALLLDWSFDDVGLVVASAVRRVAAI